MEQPGHRAYIEAARLRAGLRLEASPRDLIRLAGSIQDRIETLARANARIEEAHETLAELEADTWGIALREIEGNDTWCCHSGHGRTRAGRCGTVRP